MFTVTFTTDRRGEKALSRKLFSLGAQSLSATRDEAGSILITAIFKNLDSVTAHFPSGSMDIRRLDDSQWKYAWLEHYRGAVINDDISIEPSEGAADETGRSARYWIVLDPRDAFGDGRHPTTVLCLRRIHAILSGFSPEERRSLRFIDAGTGTGILAILACLMGTGRVDAFDIDAEAVTRTRANCDLNGCENINIFQADISVNAPEGPYDIVTANLLTAILLPALPVLRAMLKPCGTLIMSGIGSTWDGEIREGLRQNSMSVEAMDSYEGWNCYIVRISP